MSKKRNLELNAHTLYIFHTSAYMILQWGSQSKLKLHLTLRQAKDSEYQKRQAVFYKLRRSSEGKRKREERRGSWDSKTIQLNCPLSHLSRREFLSDKKWVSRLYSCLISSKKIAYFFLSPDNDQNYWQNL
jgi:hypothetical protein